VALELQTVVRGGTPQRQALESGRTRVPARPGAEYRIVDDAGKVLSGTSVKRIDNSLVIEGLPEGRSVEIADFFTACAPSGASSCALSMTELGSTAGPITPAADPIAALPDGSFLLYGGANPGGPVAVSAPIIAAADNAWKAIGAGVGGLAIAGLAAGGGGGGGGGSSADTVAPPPPTLTSKSALNGLAPTFTGTAEPGSRILLRIDVNQNGNAGDAGDVSFETITLADGTWRISTGDQAPVQGSWGGKLVDGQSYGVSAIARDLAGNLSTATNTIVSIDATAPLVPVVATIAGDSVVSAAEALAGVTLTGTGEAGTTVTVVWGSTTKTGTVAADGSWSMLFGTTELPQTQGASVVSISLTDAAGNVSPTLARVVVIDSVAPAAPAITSGALTNLALPTITGTAEAGTTVQVSFDLAGNGSIDAVYQTIASATGTWSIDTQTPAADTTLVSGSLGTGLADKVGVTLVPNTLSVVSIDSSGNAGPAATGSIARDSTIPAAPVINPVAGDNIVNFAERGTITITGTVPTASSGQPVTVTWGGTSKTVTAVGLSWSAAFAVSEIPPDGAAPVTAVSQSTTGVAGVQGTLNVSVDGTLPAAPTVTLTAASDSGTVGDNITNDTTPTVRVALNGTGATAPVAGDVVRLTVAGTLVGTATLSAGDIGADFVDVTTSALAAGSRTIAATVTDAAGNASAAGNLTLTISTAAPGAPVPTLTAASNSGSTADLVTNDPTPTIRVDFTGAAAGDVVTLTVGGTTVGTATLTGGDVAATFVNITTSALADGARTISATLTNTVGNVSPAGTVTLTIDTTLPLAPSVTLTAASDTGTAGDFITLDTTPTLRVTLNGAGATAPVAGDLVTLTVGGLTVGTATLTGTDITNDFVDITTSALTPAAGAQTVSATVQDIAGNTSTAGTLSVTISNDATPPAAPTVALAPISDTGTPGDGITNDATPVVRVTFAGAGATAPVAGDFVQLTVGGTAAGTATLTGTNITNGFVDITSTVALANGVATTVGATVRDIPGNTSTAGTTTLTADTTPPPALVAGTNFTFSITDSLAAAYTDINTAITTGTATNPDTSPLVSFNLITAIGAGESIVINRSTLVGGASVDILTVTTTGTVTDNVTLPGNTATAEAYVYRADYVDNAGNRTQLDIDAAGADNLYVIRVA
jgi:hypothetical protein